MKKLIATITAILLSFACLSACGGEVISEINKDRKQIYLELFNGGVGTTWMEDLAKEWNAKNEVYEVIINPVKNDATGIMNNIMSSGNSETAPSIYFSVSSVYKDAINQDLFEDLTDLLDYKPDGEDGLTIKQKLGTYDEYFDEWSKIAKNDKTNSGIYILPWNEAVSGFIFDYADFVENGWLKTAKNTTEVKTALDEQGITYTENGNDLLFASATGRVNYKEGDVILSAGKDGKYGTYDDGQPQTVAEWENMLSSIANSGNKTFIWTGQFAGTYINYLRYALVAQFGGKQAIADFLDKDSNGVEYEMNDGTKASFDIDTGYKSYDMKCLADMVKFEEKYLSGDSLHKACTSLSYSHSDAQNFFLLGFRGEASNPYSAMLWEGSWWENEARAMFKTNGDKDATRAYGKRDYRYMLYPDVNDVGPFGTGKGTAMAISECSSFFVPKCPDKDKLAAIKDFLAFTLNEKSLRKYTVDTGVIRPYKYSLTEEDYANMTPFARNSWELYNDTENICLIKSAVLSNQPIAYASTEYKEIAFGNYSCIPKALETENSETIINSIKNTYNATSWAKLIAELRTNGYYVK